MTTDTLSSAPRTLQAVLDDLRHIGPEMRARSAACDRDGAFVRDNYQWLRDRGLFAGLVPEDLGGKGLAHSAMCRILRELAAWCPSTALAFSMHQHLVAANVWKYVHDKGGDAMLRKVAESQPVLVSTGARDWTESNGEAVRVEGGFRVTARKAFASQSASGDVLVTSAPWEDPGRGWRVLHFPVPFPAEGLRVLDDWDTLGMRGTGSHTMLLEDVFVPDEAIVLDRPREGFHPVWNTVLGVAMPLIMAVYVGVADRAAELALEALGRRGADAAARSALGRMHNAHTVAEVMWKDMVRLAADYDFEPTDELGHAILVRKTCVANACIDTVERAMEAVGGPGYYRIGELERLWRDVRAAAYHPLPEGKQVEFTAERLLA